MLLRVVALASAGALINLMSAPQAGATLMNAAFTATVNPANTPAPAGSVALQPTQAQVGTKAGTFSNTGSLVATYSASSTASGVVQGSSQPQAVLAPGQYSAPFTSQTTQTALPYFSTDFGTITTSLNTPEGYLGIEWGSIDPGNLITFYSGQNATGVVLGSILGSDVQPAATGAQSYSGTAFLGIAFTTPFESFTATSSQISFEYAALTTAPNAIPEPKSMALLVIGLLGLAAVARSSVARPRISAGA